MRSVAMIRHMPRKRIRSAASRPSLLFASPSAFSGLVSSSPPPSHPSKISRAARPCQYYTSPSYPCLSCDWHRHFSSAADPPRDEKKKGLRETVERIKNDTAGEEAEADADKKHTAGEEGHPHVDKIAALGSSLIDAVSETWQELVASGQPKDINKKIGSPAGGEGRPNYANDDEAADKYEAYKGSKDIMLIDPEEELSAWERMQKRLTDAPIIQGERERAVRHRG